MKQALQTTYDTISHVVTIEDDIFQDFSRDFTLRKAKDEAVANDGTHLLRKDWQRFIGPIDEFGGSNPYQGNFTSLALPYTQPERIGICAYFIEYCILYDDICESATKALELDPHSDGLFFEHADSILGAKQLQSRIIVELLNIDEACGNLIIETWKNVLSTAQDLKSNIRYSNLDEYIPYRILDVGAPCVRAIMLFGMGIHLTPDEETVLKDIIHPAYAACGLTNDYFSFDREWSDREATRKDSVAPEPMKNSVWLCMGWYNLSAAEAKEMVKREIIRYEGEFHTKRRAFEEANPAHSDNIRKCLDGVAQMVIGNVAWSLQCPRYRPDLRYDPNAAVENLFLHSRTPKLEDIEATCASHKSHIATTGAYGVVAAPPATKKQLRKSLDAIAGSMISEAISSKLLADVVTAPFEWCASLPSKNVRSSLIDAFSIWFPVSRSAKDRIQTIGHLLHNASLLLDDIGDGSNLRRGQPTAHKIFGVPETINSANFAILEAMEKVSELPAPSFTVCATEMRKLFIGQGHDLLWARQHKCPSEAEYFEMIDGKTGGLFHLLTGLLMCNSTTREAQSRAQIRVYTLLTSLGRLFQVRDDYQNLVCPAYASQKGFCEDLDERKFSYPVVCALGQTEKDVSMLRNILANPREGGCLSDELKRLALKQLVSSRSLEKSRMTIMRLHAEVEKTIAEVEDMLQTPNWILRLLVKKLRVEDVDTQL